MFQFISGVFHFFQGVVLLHSGNEYHNATNATIIDYKLKVNYSISCKKEIVIFKLAKKKNCKVERRKEVLNDKIIPCKNRE